MLLALGLVVLLVATVLLVAGRRQTSAAASTAATVLGMVLVVVGVALLLVERLPPVQALAVGMLAPTAGLGVAGIAYAVYLWLRHARPRPASTSSTSAWRSVPEHHWRCCWPDCSCSSCCRARDSGSRATVSRSARAWPWLRT